MKHHIPCHSIHSTSCLPTASHIDPNSKSHRSIPTCRLLSQLDSIGVAQRVALMSCWKNDTPQFVHSRSVKVCQTWLMASSCRPSAVLTACVHPPAPARHGILRIFEDAAVNHTMNIALRDQDQPVTKSRNSVSHATHSVCIPRLGT